jgi:hypothetical protein
MTITLFPEQWHLAHIGSSFTPTVGAANDRQHT